MHKVAYKNRLCGYVSWVFFCINFLDYDHFFSTNKVIFEVNVLSPFMMDLILC